MHRRMLAIAFAIVLLLSCNLLRGSPTPPPPATDTPAAPIPVSTTEAPPTPASPTPAPPTPASRMQFLAYIYNGELLVTDVTNGTIGGTTQYTMAGESDKVDDLVWSPSGEFVAFVSSAKGDPHVFYIYAEGASTPTDLGAGSSPAWSPDSKSVAYIGGIYPDDNLWVTSIDSPAPRQLTFEKNHAWGRPAFTPDGQALIVSTADRFDMGAQGNTTFTLERLALDGSGTRTPLPGASPIEGARMPYDLRFSPDGSRLAFSTSFHLSACASPGAYYVSNADGSNQQQLLSPSLKAALDPNKEIYYVGFSYAWMPSGDALLGTGTVMDCDQNSPNMGKPIAGPQMSILRLDGTESAIIPGLFWSPSVDRTGTMLTGAHYKELGDQNPVVEIYSAQTGQLIVLVGPGSNPQFQP